MAKKMSKREFWAIFAYCLAAVITIGDLILAIIAGNLIAISGLAAAICFLISVLLRW